MKTNTNLSHAAPGVQQSASGKPGKPVAGMVVRSNLRAGAWQCRSCQGQVDGDRMINPTCSFCQFV